MLYHGTAERHLAKILVEGLSPRTTCPGNWGHTVPSNANTVYLTTAYALHFAGACVEGDERLVVVEVNDLKLDRRVFCADEDALEQLCRGQDDLPTHWDVNRRTEYYAKHADLFDSNVSLKALGTCGYRDSVPASAIKRIALIDQKTYTKLVMGGYDPQIHVTNYALLGHQYRHAMRWIFEPDTAREVEPAPIANFDWGIKYPEDRSGIEILCCEKATAKFVIPKSDKIDHAIWRAANDMFSLTKSAWA